MKTREYVLDKTNWFLKDIKELGYDVVMEKLSHLDVKGKTIPLFFEYKNLITGERKPNIKFSTIKQGDIIVYRYVVNENGWNKVYWSNIIINHKYGDVLFFTYIDGRKKGEKDYMDKSSISFITDVFPKIIRINQYTHVEDINPKLTKIEKVAC